jgi:hypothetical protein
MDFMKNSPASHGRKRPRNRFYTRHVRIGQGEGDVIETETDPRLDETLNLIGSDKVEGTAVKRSNGEHLGEIRRLMIDKASGQVAYAVVTFGGLFGVGERYYPVPWSRLRFNATLDGYELDIGDSDLATAPHFTDETVYDWSRAEGQRLDGFYGINSLT